MKSPPADRFDWKPDRLRVFQLPMRDGAFSSGRNGRFRDRSAFFEGETIPKEARFRSGGAGGSGPLSLLGEGSAREAGLERRRVGGPEGGASRAVGRFGPASGILGCREWVSPKWAARFGAAPGTVAKIGLRSGDMSLGRGRSTLGSRGGGFTQGRDRASGNGGGRRRDPTKVPWGGSLDQGWKRGLFGAAVDGGGRRHGSDRRLPGCRAAIVEAGKAEAGEAWNPTGLSRTNGALSGIARISADGPSGPTRPGGGRSGRARRAKGDQYSRPSSTGRHTSSETSLPQVSACRERDQLRGCRGCSSSTSYGPNHHAPRHLFLGPLLAAKRGKGNKVSCLRCLGPQFIASVSSFFGDGLKNRGAI